MSLTKWPTTLSGRSAVGINAVERRILGLSGLAPILRPPQTTPLSGLSSARRLHSTRRNAKRDVLA